MDGQGLRTGFAGAGGDGFVFHGHIFAAILARARAKLGLFGERANLQNDQGSEGWAAQVLENRRDSIPCFL
jgi:hypothetical protein